MEDYSSSISSSDDDIDLDDDEYKLADDVFNGFSNLNDEPAQLATSALPGTLQGESSILFSFFLFTSSLSFSAYTLLAALARML